MKKRWSVADLAFLHTGIPEATKIVIRTFGSLASAQSKMQVWWQGALVRIAKRPSMPRAMPGWPGSSFPGYFIRDLLVGRSLAVFVLLAGSLPGLRRRPLATACSRIRRPSGLVLKRSGSSPGVPEKIQRRQGDSSFQTQRLPKTATCPGTE